MMANNTVQVAIRKVRTHSVLFHLFGWPVALFNGLITLVGGAQIAESLDVAMVTFFGILTLLGIFLIVKGFKKSKVVKMYYDYSGRLASDPERSLDFLASSTGKAVATVNKEISAMIAAGFFPGMYLDSVHNRLATYNAPQPAAARNTAYTAPAAPSPAVKYITVQCKGCGATNKIPESGAGECEYCGSPLSK